MSSNNSFGSRASLTVDGKTYVYYQLGAAATLGGSTVATLPFSLKVLLENLLRNEDGAFVKPGDIEALATWNVKQPVDKEIAFRTSRVLLQDFTGVPCVVDLAAMRDALAKLGGDPTKINPLQPVDLVIDHSVQVDEYGTDAAFLINMNLEYERNRERYQFLRWGQQELKNFRAVPPGTGICHQVNLEYLGQVVFTAPEEGEGRGKKGATVAYCDSLVGTDSHTTMINGLGVLGWGVGGIEAEAAMLGQPVSMLIPEVIGFKLTGHLPAGATATDLVLTCTEMLRKKKVVGKFVEYFGDGLASLSLADRATIANMAPEYGATTGFFPADAATLDYLRVTGRDPSHIALVEAHGRAAGLFRDDPRDAPDYHRVVGFDLSAVRRTLAGPSRPHNAISPGGLRAAMQRGPSAGPGASRTAVPDGAIAIAAITSCTNTANPRAMITAGLLARNAADRGLKPKPWVKTSLAPGSRATTDILREAGLLAPLEDLGFHVIGYGCTTCGGKSGPLKPDMLAAIGQGVGAAAVLSGNRNFDGRIHRLVNASFLMSPALVVAYALTGCTNVDIDAEPLGVDAAGVPVFLRDVWPEEAEIDAIAARAVTPARFAARGRNAAQELWDAIAAPSGPLFPWDETSTYIVEPPFFEGSGAPFGARDSIEGARALGVFEDAVTTDHISPGGEIPADSPAGQYLQSLGVTPDRFNSYVGRRGNHNVLMRGAYANVRIRNRLASGREGWWTKAQPSGERMSVFDAAHFYFQKGVPLIVMGGAANKAQLQSPDRKSTRLNSSHVALSRMPSSA